MLKHVNTKFNSRPELFLFSGLLAFTLLSATLLASSHATADNDSVTDNISIEVPVSCTMTGTGQNSHEATLLPGTYSGASGSQYQNGIGTTTLTTFCNDNNGFSIYAIGYSNDTDGNNTLIGENTSLTIPTKVYEATDTTSNWSMKVNKVENETGQDPVAWNPENMTITNSFSSWHTVPDDYAKVAEYKATTGSSATDTTLGGKVTTTYASYISTTQAADTYEGQVKYVMVHPYDHTAPEKPATFTWQESTATRPADADVRFMMQDFDTATCNLGTTGQIGWVKDSRDNTVYTIGKLADGKCWMTENLDLAGGTALSADDTDVTSVYIDSFSTSNNLTKTGDTIVLPGSSTSGFNTYNYSYVYNSGNKTNCGASGQNTPCYSYYSWDAATLGSGRTLNTENTDAPYSICPKGWRLPTTGKSSNNEWKRGDFYKLATAYGVNLESNYYESSSTFYNNVGPNTTVPNFLLAGYYNIGSFKSGGSYGLYWSSTSFSDTLYARSLSFGSGNVRSANNYYRYYGFSVRCLLSGS